MGIVGVFIFFTLWHGNTDTELIDEPIYYECAKNIGGELASEIGIYDPNVLLMLQNNGIPVIVECVVPYTNAIKNDREHIARAFISYFVNLEIDKAEEIHFEIRVENKIEAKDIIDIHE